MTLNHTTRRSWVTCVTAATVTALVGCSGGSSSEMPRSPAASQVTSQPASSATSGSEAAEVPTSSADPVTGAVAAAYRGYWAARVKAQAAPDQPPPAELDRYAIGTARTDVKANMLRFRQQGIAFRGEPLLAPVVTVTRPPTTGAEGEASIVDCVDSSHWAPVFVDTGTSALAAGQALRVVVESTARTYEGRWVVDTSVAHRDRPC